jgi:uncharacterized protein
MIFDFNIHLPYLIDNDVNNVVGQDLRLDESGLIEGLNFHMHELKDVDGGNILLFNVELFNEDISAFTRLVKSKLDKSSFTALIDFRSPKIYEYLDVLSANNIDSVMVNSYLQKIDKKEYDFVYRAFKYASDLGMNLCIDGSYGTSKMFTYDNLDLACFIADKISHTNIIIIHSGGYRLIPALLLALDKKNVWLDTSFSLTYYENSSLELDFAYALRKLNCRNVVYGSDHPYVNAGEALEAHLRFFEKFNFRSSEIDQILGINAMELLNG